jgi:tungstate ABC transporter binding protein WtpA
MQHGLNFLSIPSALNLGDPEMANFYSKARVRLTDGTWMYGEPIQFALTIPKNAQHKEMARVFFQFVMSPEGKEILEKNGFPLISPLVANDIQKVPPELREYFEKENVNFTFPEHLAKEPMKFHIFHAGALTKAFAKLEAAFEQKYPNVDVINEPHGSRTAVRQITELKRTADFVAVADYSVIEKLMFPDYSDWYGIFARNEMVLIYDDNSKYVSEINEENWPEILLREDVHFGRSDPDQDPSGYRTIILWKLADRYFSMTKEKRKQVFQDLAAGDNLTALSVYVDGKVQKSFSKNEIKKLLSSSQYSVAMHPVKKGIAVKDFFEGLNVSLKNTDEISFEGKGSAKIHFNQAIEQGMGFVLTRKGTMRLVAQTGPYSDKRKSISHLRTIKVSKQ